MLDRPKWEVAVFALLLLPVVWRMPPGIDAFLYHFPVQDWILRHSIINMVHENSRFGFDSVEETIAAMFTPRVAQWGWLTLLVAFLSRSPSGAIVLFGLIINPLYLVIGQSSTDTPAGIMFAVAFLSGSTAAGALAFMLKPTAGLALLWCAPRAAPVRLILPAALVAAWMLHGVLVSGCAVYPLCPSGANDAQWVIAWARNPGAGLTPLHSWSWITDWWLPHYWVFLLFEAGTLTLCIAAAGIKVQVMPLLFVLFCLGVWFIGAPSPRFAIGEFLVLPAVICGKWKYPTWTAWLPYICALRLDFL